jgi:uncharacterized membrane protein
VFPCVSVCVCLVFVACDKFQRITPALFPFRTTVMASGEHWEAAALSRIESMRVIAWFPVNVMACASTRAA